MYRRDTQEQWGGKAPSFIRGLLGGRSLDWEGEITGATVQQGLSSGLTMHPPFLSKKKGWWRHWGCNCGILEDVFKYGRASVRRVKASPSISEGRAGHRHLCTRNVPLIYCFPPKADLSWGRKVTLKGGPVVGRNVYKTWRCLSEMLLLLNLVSPSKSERFNYSVGRTDPNKTGSPQSPSLSVGPLRPLHMIWGFSPK